MVQNIPQPTSNPLRDITPKPAAAPSHPRSDTGSPLLNLLFVIDSSLVLWSPYVFYMDYGETCVRSCKCICCYTYDRNLSEKVLRSLLHRSTTSPSAPKLCVVHDVVPITRKELYPFVYLNEIQPPNRFRLYESICFLTVRNAIHQALPTSLLCFLS